MREKISIQMCRDVLGKTDLTDQEIEQLRDSLYVWLERLLEQHFRRRTLQ